MNEARDFLVELGTEELPPKALYRLAEAFGAHMSAALEGLGMGTTAVEVYASPRRLAVLVRNLGARQPDQVVERRGPAVRAAFDADGTPTAAAQGFARACGVDVADLQRVTTDKGEWLSCTAEIPGRTVAELLPGLVQQALAALPIPKRMRWGAGEDEFARPVRWLLMLYGEQCIDAEILGARSARYTFGHRFHSTGPIKIDSAAAYASTLESQGKVIADFARRRDRVRELTEACARDNDAVALIDGPLLDEVTALVEWPVAVCGSFDEHFLELPREVLVASMQGHQKYFPLEDAGGSLTNKFITISNLESLQPEVVRHGNERVIRPRLSDAAFFWHKDGQNPLRERMDKLGTIVFEQRLGSLLDKTERIRRLGQLIAPAFKADAADADRAAALSRCDLVTEMVGEFPELQGIMGAYYAARDGEPKVVYEALRDFYRPRFAGDAVPASAVGQIIAVADKLDTLVGIFSIGGEPTGDKDPYALRRAAIGVIRVLVEGGIDLDLGPTLEQARRSYGDTVTDHSVEERVLQFVIERLRGYYLDSGVAPDVLDAVLVKRPGNPHDIERRIRAVSAFRVLPEAQALAGANKRIANILRKSDDDGTTVLDFALLLHPEERALAEHLVRLENEVEPLALQNDYAGYLGQLATVRDAVDAFFDSVMVMCDDNGLRRNRLALLTRMHQLFTQIADISRLTD